MVNLATARQYMSELMGDYFASKTSAAGSANRDTFVDTTLKRFRKDTVKDWWVLFRDVPQKYQGYTGPSTYESMVFADVWMAQTFTTTGSFVITGVKLPLFRVPDSVGTTLTVSIRATTTSKPSGSDLASGTLDFYKVLPKYPGDWYWIEFTTPYLLSASTMYAIVVRSDAANIGNSINWHEYRTARVYSGGSTCQSTDVGVSWIAQATYDFLFETWGYSRIMLGPYQIKEWLPDDCVGILYDTADLQITADTTYELHKFNPDDKKRALNKALHDSYPYFYRPLTSVFIGKDYNRVFDVPTKFKNMPLKIWKAPAFTGANDTASSTVLTDSDLALQTNELIGHFVYNVTGLSRGLITSNTATTVTCSDGLFEEDGDVDTWAEADEYAIIKNQAWERIYPKFFHTEHPDPYEQSKVQFQAYVTDDYVIILEGKGYLTEFDTDLSETELDATQARILAYKAAANFYRMQTRIVNSHDREQFMESAAEMDEEFAWED